MGEPIKNTGYDMSEAIAAFHQGVSGGLPFLGPNLDDTSVVVLATSLLDELLKFVLLGGFHAPSTSNTLVDTVFKGDGPLSRFSDRIKICTALGIIRDDIQHDLSVLRGIRNDFAHSHQPLRLSGFTSVKSLKTTSNLTIEDGDEHRRIFKACCAGLVPQIAALTLMHIARGRFINKNQAAILEEFEIMMAEAENAE